MEFGQYQVVRRLAAGGMGEVYLARDRDRVVIVKTLLPSLAAHESFVKQFLDEARVVAKLRHPNIVATNEVGIWNGTYFIVMEYIRGENLARIQSAAEKVRPIPVEVAVSIVHDAALGLHHAHGATDFDGRTLNIVHRDVSPQNIMVRSDGVAKVVDFGLAKAANRLTLTERGLMKGKPQYMAPEQVEGMELDGRADQFALGIVLWELCARRSLFAGKNDVEILNAVVEANVPRLREVAAPLADVVERMLARDRDARFATLADCARELSSAVGAKSLHDETAQYLKDVLGVADLDVR